MSSLDKHVIDKSIQYIESWLRFRAERTDLPGFAVAIAHQGKLIFSQAYGYANLEKKEKLTPGHIFRIASHSKTVTATAIMQLQEAGKLRIDDTVATYVPWLKEHTDKRFLNITIRQVLCHRAGIIRDGLDGDYWQLMQEWANRDQLREHILAADLVYDNNVKMKYSNFGFALLGLVIESVADQSYSEYVTRHILAPLALTRIGPDYTPAIKNKMATGYTQPGLHRRRLPITKEVSTNAMAAATGFYATAEDLCAYFSAQFVGTGKLLSDESKKEMQRQQSWVENTKEPYHYGLGMEIQHPDNQRVFGHSGGFPGFISKTICEPEEQLVITVLTNCTEPGASSMALGMFKTMRYFAKNMGAAPKHHLHQFEGRYMNLFDTLDIVATGNRIVMTNPNSWSPLSHPNELGYVDSKTLSIKKIIGFETEGELVHFDKDSIRCAGMTLWPEHVYERKLAHVKRIELRANSHLSAG